MPTLTLLPDYAMFTVRDAYCDAAVGFSEAIDVARRDVAASTGYEIYVCCAQEILKVTVDVHVDRDDVPQLPDADGVIRLPLTCPTGELRVGDVTGCAIAVDLPEGAGRYDVVISHRGRAASAALAVQLLGEGSGGDFDGWMRRLGEHAGVEQYLVRLTRVGPVPDDEDEEDEDD
jgi:hypothetical protein